MPVIAVDAGGTYLRFGVADDAGEVRLLSRRRIPNSLDYNGAAVWESIAESIAAYVDGVARLTETGDAIALAVPGPVADGRLVCAPTVSGGALVPDIAGLLESRTQRRVHLVNDVSAAAWYLGERLEADRFFVVTVSSGIGGKLFDRGHSERVLDASPYAGEIGHIVVDASAGAARCDCGGRGHLGALSSARATERMARDLARAEPTQFVQSAIARSLAGRPDAITNEEHLVPAALAGDAWALSVIERAAYPLAHVLSTLTASIGLERIVIIGGFAQRLGSVYEGVIRRQLSELLSAQSFARVARDHVLVYDEGTEVCLAGAAAFYYARCGVG